jgi:hypothetical protein
LGQLLKVLQVFFIGRIPASLLCEGSRALIMESAVLCCNSFGEHSVWVFVFEAFEHRFIKSAVTIEVVDRNKGVGQLAALGKAQLINLQVQDFSLL